MRRIVENYKDELSRLWETSHYLPAHKKSSLPTDSKSIFEAYLNSVSCQQFKDQSETAEFKQRVDRHPYQSFDAICSGIWEQVAYTFASLNSCPTTRIVSGNNALDFFRNLLFPDLRICKNPLGSDWLTLKSNPDFLGLSKHERGVPMITDYFEATLSHPNIKPSYFKNKSQILVEYSRRFPKIFCDTNLVFAVPKSVSIDPNRFDPSCNSKTNLLLVEMTHEEYFESIGEFATELEYFGNPEAWKNYIDNRINHARRKIMV